LYSCLFTFFSRCYQCCNIQAKLVEDVVMMALECESESKDERAASEKAKQES